MGKCNQCGVIRTLDGCCLFGHLSQKHVAVLLVRAGPLRKKHEEDLQSNHRRQSKSYTPRPVTLVYTDKADRRVSINKVLHGDAEGGPQVTHDRSYRLERNLCRKKL